MKNKDEIFSEEYSPEESTDTKINIFTEEINLDQTSTSDQSNYSISKPRRVTIKAIITHD